MAGGDRVMSKPLARMPSAWTVAVMILAMNVGVVGGGYCAARFIVWMFPAAVN